MSATIPVWSTCCTYHMSRVVCLSPVRAYTHQSRSPKVYLHAIDLVYYFRTESGNEDISQCSSHPTYEPLLIRCPLWPNAMQRSTCSQSGSISRIWPSWTAQCRGSSVFCSGTHVHSCAPKTVCQKLIASVPRRRYPLIFGAWPQVSTQLIRRVIVQSYIAPLYPAETQPGGFFSQASQPVARQDRGAFV